MTTDKVHLTNCTILYSQPVDQRYMRNTFHLSHPVVPRIATPRFGLSYRHYKSLLQCLGEKVSTALWHVYQPFTILFWKGELDANVLCVGANVWLC